MKAITVLILILQFFFGSLKFGFVPTITFDAGTEGPGISHGGAGFLYGLAEENVPDALTVEALAPKIAAQKVPDGLQHPIGDVSHVAGNLESCDYIVVYLQDAFSTWYYANDDINEARRAGTYDWRTFLTEVYFPTVRESVEKLRAESYADRVVYCLYNECDNGVWFGTWNGEYAAFDDAGRDAFFEAWALTFDYVRALAPDALIGGPGYYEYNARKEYDFLSYCKAHGCLPDVMIWHELGERSSELLDLHVSEYRDTETALGISALPIAVTEYGTMEECGDPAKLLSYLRQMEECGVYGCIAYWRLADNLCDTSADGVSPNACWWLYRWYAMMRGTRMDKQVSDLFHADFGKAVREGRALRNKYLNGFGAVNGSKDTLWALVGGADYTAQVRFIHTDKTAVGKTAHVKVESVSFMGLGGAVYAPTLVKEYDVSVSGGKLNVRLENMDPNSVYLISVTAGDGRFAAYTNKNLPVRTEFESGALLGNAYTYDPAYASTGETAGLVGGMEHPGDGVEIGFSVPETGDYTLGLIYGKANDGAGPDGRVSALADLTLDGETRTVLLPNTIRSEYTALYTLDVRLTKGEHTLRMEHNTGTFVLDSLVTQPAAGNEIYVQPTGEAGAYYAFAPQNGWYRVITAGAFTVNGSLCQKNAVYLRQGINRLDLSDGAPVRIFAAGPFAPTATVTPEAMTLSGGASAENGALTGITSEGGEARFSVNAPESGDYRVTLTYSNNAEGGYHAYNVDLIEQYVTLTVNGQTQRVWCRSTYSHDTRANVTCTVRLAAGENLFTLTNDGLVRFDGRETGAPRIYGVQIDPVCR